MGQPLVTIGITCRDNARTLAAAVDSALKQTVRECQVILIDDGSSDLSPVIATAYGDSICHVRTERWGLNHARGLVFQHALGEWIQFMEADVFLLPDKLERQFAEAKEAPEADVLYGPVWHQKIGRDGRPEGNRSASALSPELGLPTLWLSGRMPPTGGLLWRRSAFEEIGGWKNNEKFCQEEELCLRAIQKGLKFHYTATPGAVYPAERTQVDEETDPLKRIRAKTALIDDFKKWLTGRREYSSSCRRAAGQVCFEMARQLAVDDWPAAVTYHNERRKAHCLYPAGPTAPFLYEMTYRLCGFSAAESLARCMGGLGVGGRTEA